MPPEPRVTVGLVVGGRFPAKDLLPYVVAQCVGGAIAAALILTIAGDTKIGYDLAGGLASNGYGDHSPDGYGLVAGLITEIVMTAIFLVVILGATDRLASSGMAGLAIGLCLTLIHLISIPITNTSVNPARSLGRR
jgi:aquaporin Z